MVHIKRLHENDVDIITPVGEVDASSSIDLDLAIAKSISEGYKKILIDCHALEYISSAGLGVFMSYIEELKDSNVIMILYSLNEKVLRSFQILGLASLLLIKDTKEEAQLLANDFLS